METNIVPEDEGRALIQERIWSKEYWVFLAPDRMGVEMAHDVQQAFYADNDSDDFDGVMIGMPFFPCVCLVVFFARKSAASYEQLRTILTNLPSKDGGHDLFGPDTFLGHLASTWMARSFTGTAPDEKVRT